MNPRDYERDMLGDQFDARISRLIDDLNKLYNVSAQPDHLRLETDRVVGESIRGSAQSHHAAKRNSGPYWQRRKVLIGAVVIAAVVVGGASAASPLVDQLLPTVILQHSNALSLSQSTCGFTMTVARAYADANRVIIGYMFTWPTNRSYSPEAFPFDSTAAPRLTDAQGHQFLLLKSYESVVQGTIQGQILEFDASSISDMTHPIPLRLVVPAIAMTEQATDGMANAQPCITFRQSNVPPSFRSAPVQTIEVNGRFTFNVTVPPLLQERMIQLHQVAQAGDEDVILERVVVTPSDTRVYLQRAAGVGIDVQRPQLTVAGATYEGVPIRIQTSTGSYPYFSNVLNPAGVVEYTFPLAPILFEDHSTWTLTVPTREKAITFHFDVP